MSDGQVLVCRAVREGLVETLPVVVLEDLGLGLAVHVDVVLAVRVWRDVLPTQSSDRRDDVVEGEDVHRRQGIDRRTAASSQPQGSGRSEDAHALRRSAAGRNAEGQRASSKRDGRIVGHSCHHGVVRLRGAERDRQRVGCGHRAQAPELQLLREAVERVHVQGQARSTGGHVHHGFATEVGGVERVSRQAVERLASVQSQLLGVAHERGRQRDVAGRHVRVDGVGVLTRERLPLLRGIRLRHGILSRDDCRGPDRHQPGAREDLLLAQVGHPDLGARLGPEQEPGIQSIVKDTLEGSVLEQIGDLGGNSHKC